MRNKMRMMRMRMFRKMRMMRMRMFRKMRMRMRMTWLDAAEAARDERESAKPEIVLNLGIVIGMMIGMMIGMKFGMIVTIFPGVPMC